MTNVEYGKCIREQAKVNGKVAEVAEGR